MHYIDEQLQKYPISKIAASSVILAINIFKLREKFIKKFGDKNKDKNGQQSDRFFQQVESENKTSANILFYLNTDLWNNKNMFKLTGYSIEDLKESLIALSKFVSDNLVPNKLKYFDLDAI